MYKEEAIFNLRVNTSGDVEAKTVKESLEGIEDAVRNVKKEFKEGIAVTQFEKLNKVVDESVLSIQELGTAADNYKNIALSAGTESVIGKEAIKRAAQLEKQIDTLNRRVADLGESGKVLKTALDIGTGVVAGYNIAAGAAAFLGDENEELTQTLVKLQAAQSVLMGLQEVKILLDKNGAIAVLAQTVATKAQTAATIAAQGPMVFMNAIMAANPVGLVVVAIGALIAALLFLPEVVSKVVKWFDSLNKYAKIAAFIFGGPLIASIIAVRWALQQLGATETDQEREAARRAEMRKERLKQEIKDRRELQKEIRKNGKERIAIADEEVKVIDFQLRKLKAAGKDTVEYERMKIMATRKAVEERIEALEYELSVENQIAQRRLELLAVDNVFSQVIGRTEKLTKQTYEKANELEAQLTELREQRRKATEDLAIFEITETTRVNDAAKDAAQDRKDREAKEWEEEKQRIREKVEFELSEGKRKYEEEQKQREEAQQVHDDFLAKSRAHLKAKEAKDAKDEKKRKEQELKDAEKLAKAKIAIEEAVFSIASSLIELGVKNEEQAMKFRKAVAVAQLGIDTAKAIAGAVAQAQNVPFPGNLAAIATGVATVLANIAQARKILQETAGVSMPQITSVNSGNSGLNSAFSSSSVGGEQGFSTNPFANINPPQTQIVAIVEDINRAQNRVSISESRSTVR